MDALMTDRVQSTVQTYSYEAVSASVGLAAVLLLLVLLSIKELMRARDPERFKQWAEALDIAIAPLVLTFGVIVLARIAYYVIIAPLG